MEGLPEVCPEIHSRAVHWPERLWLPLDLEPEQTGSLLVDYCSGLHSCEVCFNQEAQFTLYHHFLCLTEGHTPFSAFFDST